MLEANRHTTALKIDRKSGPGLTEDPSGDTSVDTLSPTKTLACRADLKEPKLPQHSSRNKGEVRPNLFGWALTPLGVVYALRLSDPKIGLENQMPLHAQSMAPSAFKILTNNNKNHPSGPGNQLKESPSPDVARALSMAPPPSG